MIFIYSGEVRSFENLRYHVDLINSVSEKHTIVGSFWHVDPEMTHLVLDLADQFSNVYFEFLEKPPLQSNDEDLQDLSNESYGWRVHSQFQSVANSISYAQNLLSDFEKQNCVRIRPDLLINRRLLRSIIKKNVESNDVYVPHVGHYIGVNDMFWLTSGNNMAYFLSLPQFTREFIARKGGLNIPEIIVREFMTSLDLDISYDIFNLPSILVRGSTGKYHTHTKFYTNLSAHLSAANVRKFNNKLYFQGRLDRFITKLRQRYLNSVMFDFEMNKVCREINNRHYFSRQF